MMSPSEYHGIVVVDKPAGQTSHDVVNSARRLFRTKRVGHTGTLDPDATGVLVLCLGNGTRLAEYLSAARKHYITEVEFGIETDTQDASGQVIAQRDASFLTEAAIRAALPGFRGRILQTPPMVSARHHQGKRLYELAREGVTVEREARPVEIDLLELTAFTPGVHPKATLEVTCSTGVYIRTLAFDLGAALNVGATMATLRRTWVGEQDRAFTLAEAHTLEDLRERADGGTLAEVVLPLSTALHAWPQAWVDAEATARLRNGQSLTPAEFTLSSGAGRPETPIAIRMAGGDVCAVGRLVDGRLQPMKVLMQ